MAEEEGPSLQKEMEEPANPALSPLGATARRRWLSDSAASRVLLEPMARPRGAQREDALAGPSVLVVQFTAGATPPASTLRVT